MATVSVEYAETYGEWRVYESGKIASVFDTKKIAEKEAKRNAKSTDTIKIYKKNGQL